MLRVDIRDLQRGPVQTVGQLQPDDPAFEGLDLDLVGPVSVKGQLQASGDGEYLWRGSLHGVLQGECRRCLTEVRTGIDIDVDAAVFSSDPDASDDPDFYPLLERASHIDIRDVAREELALAIPARLLLCREDCAGLCLSCGADLNAGPCGCSAPAEPA
ncbi:MAG: YceD family protein [Gemmatimonadales bacterium]